ncbi:MAG: AraC family transcriptional regulator [Paenibacillaceae bacterium ZCTH02-B3]|nr:MAG: AraC family transcriptional regulator [Paenibacillaceae bacterium ZCTH02-B3]
MLAINLDMVPKIGMLGFVSYKTPWIHFRRTTDEYILYFVRDGELHIHENGIPYVLGRGDLLLLEPGLEHEGLQKHTCDYYYFHFRHPDIRPYPEEDAAALAKRVLLEEKTLAVLDTDLLGKRAVHDANRPGTCYFPKFFSLKNRPMLQQAFRMIEDILMLYERKANKGNLTALRLAELFLELSHEYLMAELHQARGRSSRSFLKVNALLEYLHQHYTEKISSADIEAAFDCNFDYMNRIFKQATGHTIFQYCNRIRINKAKELIQATHLDIGEIGYLVGVDDPYYFSKLFKKMVGLSPMQYYKKVRESPEESGPV